MELLITGGTLLDQTGERRRDVRVVDGTICEVGVDLVAGDGARRLAAAGCIVSPGFVDLHAHLREPGTEEAETIETGSRAAAKGGYTCVVAMPNTDPTQDSVSVVEFVRRQGQAAGLCDVRPSGSITIGRLGQQLSPLGELAGAGVHLFTDDGTGVQDPLLMRRALEYALDLGVVLAQHCEVARLTEGAVMHEGRCCAEFGLPGWPSLAEELMVHRDIELSRLTGAPVHLLHLSTAGSVDLVRRAKDDGVRVTAEATPHHISLTDDLLAGYDSRFKVNPPLRTMADVEAVRAGLADGTIDAIATDHAPHHRDEKVCEFDKAAFGIVGLETMLPLSLELVRGGYIDLNRMIDALSTQPAKVLGIGRGTLAVGAPADIAIFDPDREWTLKAESMATKSRNTPFDGWKLKGKTVRTLVGGVVVWEDEQ
jgi:dihydroorotase